MAVKERKYKKPPVIEALCEIYFADSNWDDTISGRFYDRIKEQFPDKRQRDVQQARVEFQPQGGVSAASIRRLPSWMQFISPPRGRMIQVAQNLVVVNQLKPYTRFADWEPTIHLALKTYSELARPRAIVRVGLRYINHIAVPGDRIRMEDYFRIYPKLPDPIGDTHGAFLVRAEAPSVVEGHQILITFGTAPAEPGRLAFLLDLYDIFQPDQPGAGFEDFPRVVAQAHQSVVAAFEGSLTDRLRKLLDEEEPS